MASQNFAAWLNAPKADLEISEVPFYTPGPDELLIKNEAIALQPFESKIRKDAYIKIPYPFILGNNVAGTVIQVGANVTNLSEGDRVLSSTPVFTKMKTKYGAWQKFVLSKASLTAKIGFVNFAQAIAFSVPLSTAVAALQVYLGMKRPGELDSATAKSEKVLVWGAGSAVGAYAVQYAKKVGHTVVATASPHGFEHLKDLGASQVLDYKSGDLDSQLREQGPFKYIFTASGDPASQQAIGKLLQPNGGRFASTLGGNVDLPSNVERIYEMFESTAQKFPDFGRWWYEEYIPTAVAGALEPTPIEERSGGLSAIQNAADDVVALKTKKKIVINPQDS